jgi:hypothetical protein
LIFDNRLNLITQDNISDEVDRNKEMGIDEIA